MNQFGARAERVDGKWQAHVRYVHKSRYVPLMAGDRPATYPDELTAELAAYREALRHLNSTVTGWRGSSASARAAAEKLFHVKPERMSA